MFKRSSMLSGVLPVALAVASVSAVGLGTAAPVVAADKAVALKGKIVATGSKVTGTHTIAFTDWSGEATMTGGKPEGAQIRFAVKTAAMDVDAGKRNDWTPKLEEHLKSPDFFDVAKFPTASFKSTAIKADGKGYTVTGELTLRGVTKKISFPASIEVGGGKIKAKTEFAINRKDFGITYAGKADDLIREGVVLAIELEGNAQ